MSDNGPADDELVAPAVLVVMMLSAALDFVTKLPTRPGGSFLQVEAQLDEAGRYTNVLGLRCELGNFSATVEPLERPAVTCPRCGATSHNRTDVAEGYCGRCKDWTARVHPAEVTADRLLDALERWPERFDGRHRDAVGELRAILDDIAGGAASP